MRKISWKQVCRWNWHRRSCVKLVWINGRTGRRSFNTGRIPNHLLIIWKYQQGGIEMVNPVMTYRGHELEIPKVTGYRMGRIITEAKS